jgi:hypothetical protein
MFDREASSKYIFQNASVYGQVSVYNTTGLNSLRFSLPCVQ